MKRAVFLSALLSLSTPLCAEPDKLNITKFKDWGVVTFAGSSSCFAISQSGQGDVRVLLNAAGEIVVNFKIAKMALPQDTYKIGIRIDDQKPWTFVNALGKGTDVSVALGGAAGAQGVALMRGFLDGKNLFLLDNLGGVKARFSLSGSGQALRAWHGCSTGVS